MLDGVGVIRTFFQKALLVRVMASTAAHSFPTRRDSINPYAGPGSLVTPGKLTASGPAGIASAIFTVPPVLRTAFLARKELRGYGVDLPRTSMGNRAVNQKAFSPSGTP